MITYNRIIASLLALSATSWSHALTFNQPEIQSAQNQLLYIEIPYSGAANNTKISANLANDDDLVQMGVSPSHNLGELNFFIRQTGSESGVIVITSTRPIQDKKIDLVLKVKDGDAVHLQQIHTPLTYTATTPQAKAQDEQVLVPQKITNEDEIGLQLPQSQHYISTQKPQIVASATPKVPTVETHTKPRSEPKATSSYTVKNQDTLWSIASKISHQTQRPLNQVMKELKQLNQHAFVNGNVNRLRQGVTLNTQLNQVNEIKPKAEKPKTMPQTTKYRLSQAEMTLVGDKQSKAYKEQGISPELSKKLGHSRQNALALQNKVTQLDEDLRHKELKLELLNTRLAQLQQRLKEQNAKKSSP